MFHFLNRKDSAQIQTEAKKVTALVRPEVDTLMSYAAGPANKAMAEYYATLYFLWLAREKADWKALSPYLPEAALGSLVMMRLRPEDRKKRLADIRSYWRTLEKEEKLLLRAGRNPLGWLENRESGLAGIAAGDREFAENLLIVTSALIRRLDLKGYEKYALPREAPAEKQPLSDLRPQPQRPEQFITVTDHQGNAVKLQLLDIITTADGTFSCLRPENRTEFVVFKNIRQPGGRTAYTSAGVSETKLVLAVFQTRNPQYFPEIPES